MLQAWNTKRDVVAAFLFGSAALGTNLLLTFFFPTQVATAGNIFLFLASSTLGLSHTLVAVAVGVLPQSYVLHDQFYALRLILLCASISIVSKSSPRTPSFAVALFLWVVLFAPLMCIVGERGQLGTSFSFGSVIYSGLIEVLLVMISGTLSLNTSIWVGITNRARHVPIHILLTHVFALTSTTVIFISTVIPSSPITFADMSGNDMDYIVLAFTFAMGILAPAAIGWRLATIITNRSQDFFGASLLPSGGATTFGGLSSPYWRRQAELDEGDILRGDHSNRDSSGDNSIPGEYRAGLAPDQGICAVNKDGTIVFLNRRFKSMTEIQHNDALGRKIDTVGMNKAICSCITQLLEDSFSTSRPRSTEIKLNQLPNKLRFFEIATRRTSEFENSSVIDGPDSIIVTVKDITERRTVEAHLLQGQKLTALGNLVRGIGHSFNNFLTTITGQASYGKYVNEKSDWLRILDEILQASKGAAELSRKLLDFADGKPGTMKRQDLRDEIETKLDLIRNVLGENSTLTFEAPSTPVQVNCDSNLLTQAISNLVINSRDAYGENGGRIQITLDTEKIEPEYSDFLAGSRPGQFARLKIIDTGHGMSPDVLSRAFDPLFTTKSNRGNVGLGLSTVFAIVRAHDGFLTAESQPDKGTTITIYLPIAEAETEFETDLRHTDAVNGTPATNGHPVTGNSERILIVEDETQVRNLVAKMLSNLGYRVVTCHNGDEALNQYVSDKFDLVIVDMVLPKMHGSELIAKLAEHDPNTPVVLMTGYGITGDAKECGTQFIIPKPFDLETLARTVRASLTKPRMTQTTATI